MMFTIPCPLTLHLLDSKYCKDWPCSSCEENVHARRTTLNDERQPIAMSHLSDTGDRKKCIDASVWYPNRVFHINAVKVAYCLSIVN